jgi:hypothetical protein
MIFKIMPIPMVHTMMPTLPAKSENKTAMPENTKIKTNDASVNEAMDLNISTALVWLFKKPPHISTIPKATIIEENAKSVKNLTKITFHLSRGFEITINSVPSSLPSLKIPTTITEHKTEMITNRNG